MANHNVFHSLNFVRIVGIDEQQDPAFFHTLGVNVRLFLANPHSYQPSNEAAIGCTNTGAGSSSAQNCGPGPRCQHRSETRYEQSTGASDQTDQTTTRCATERASSSTLQRRLSFILADNFFYNAPLGENTDIVSINSGIDEIGCSQFCLLRIYKDTYHFFHQSIASLV